MKMENKDIKSKLERLKPVLKERYQVETIGFFGSYARGEQNQKSDIDILVELKIRFFHPCPWCGQSLLTSPQSNDK